MIDKLEMFLALAQARHFGRAAQAVGVTQPTLSAAIKSLEDQLGVMLVLRGSRFQGLTPEGKRALDWARQIVGDTRTMREELRAARTGTGLSGNLRLAAIPTALTALSRLTSRFAAAHPGVRITVQSTSSVHMLTLLEDLQIDAGISYLEGEPLGRVTTVPLYDERYVVICHAEAPLAGHASLRWADLSGVPLCLLTPVMQNRRIIAGHLADAGVAVAPQIESDSIIVLMSHLMHSAPAAGLSTILPLRAAEIFLRHGPLRAIPLTDPDAAHPVGLIAPYREPHTPVLAALLLAARPTASIGKSNQQTEL